MGYLTSTSEIHFFFSSVRPTSSGVQDLNSSFQAPDSKSIQETSFTGRDGGVV